MAEEFPSSRDWLELGDNSDVLYQFYASLPTSCSLDSSTEASIGEGDSPRLNSPFEPSGMSRESVLWKRYFILRDQFCAQAKAKGLRKPKSKANVARRRPRKKQYASQQRRRVVRGYELGLPMNSEEYFMISSVAGPSGPSGLAQQEEEEGRVHRFLNSNICTFKETGRNFQVQRWYNCRTCGLTGNTGCCEACVLRCHLGHEVSYRKTGKFYCDCGSGHNGVTCKALKPLGETNDISKKDSKEIPQSGLFEYYCKLVGVQEPADSSSGDIPSASGMSTAELRLLAQKIASVSSLRLDDPSREPVFKLKSIIHRLADRADKIVNDMKENSLRLRNEDVFNATETCFTLCSLAIAIGVPECILMAVRVLVKIGIKVPNFRFEFKDKGYTHPIEKILNNISSHLSELDLPLLRRSALQFEWEEEMAYITRPSRTNAHALAVGAKGKYVYLHSSGGLEKIGTGLNGTERGKVYLSDLSFHPSERLSVCCIGDRLYVKGAATRPSVWILDCADFSRIGSLQLSEDAQGTEIITDKTGPGNFTSSPIVTNGQYLYSVSALYVASNVTYGMRLDGDIARSKTSNSISKKKTFAPVSNGKIAIRVSVYDPSQVLNSEDVKREISDARPSKPKSIKDVLKKRLSATFDKLSTDRKSSPQKSSPQKPTATKDSSKSFIKPDPLICHCKKMGTALIEFKINRPGGIDGLRKALETGCVYCTGHELVIVSPSHLPGVSCPIPGKYSIKVFSLVTGKLVKHHVLDRNPQFLRASYHALSNTIYASTLIGRSHKHRNRLVYGSNPTIFRFEAFVNQGQSGSSPLHTRSRTLKSASDAVCAANMLTKEPLDLGLRIMAHMLRILGHVNQSDSLARQEPHPAKEKFIVWLRLRKEASEAERRYQKQAQLQKERKSSKNMEKMDDVDVLLHIGAAVEAKCGVSSSRTGQLGHQPWRRSYRGKIMGVRYSDKGDATYDIKFEDGESVPDVRRSEITAIVAASGEVLHIPGNSEDLEPSQRDKLAMLEAMGFSRFTCLHALKQTRWSLERAVDYMTTQVESVAMAEQQYIIAQHSLAEEAARVRKAGVNNREPVEAAEKRMHKAKKDLKKIVDHLGLDFKDIESVVDIHMSQADLKEKKDDSKGKESTARILEKVFFCSTATRSRYVFHVNCELFSSAVDLLLILATSIARINIKDRCWSDHQLEFVSIAVLKVLGAHMMKLVELLKDFGKFKDRIKIREALLSIAKNAAGKDVRETAANMFLNAIDVFLPSVQEKLEFLETHLGEELSGSSRGKTTYFLCKIMEKFAKVLISRKETSHSKKPSCSCGKGEASNTKEAGEEKVTESSASLLEGLLNLSRSKRFERLITNIISFIEIRQKDRTHVANGILRSGPVRLLKAIITELILRSNILDTNDIEIINQSPAETSPAEYQQELFMIAAKSLKSATRQILALHARVKALEVFDLVDDLPRSTHQTYKSTCMVLLPSLVTLFLSPKLQLPKQLATSIYSILQDAIVAVDKLVQVLLNGSEAVRLLAAKHAMRNIKNAKSIDETDIREKRFVIETGHPYGCGSNILSRHIHIPGADAICLRFDPRSCTEDRSDCVKLYTDMNKRVRLPFGPFYGNELDGNAQWPKKHIIIEGDKVTISFDGLIKPQVMKDVQQQLEEDTKARWGFRCIAHGLRFQRSPLLVALLQSLVEASSVLMKRVIAGDSFETPGDIKEKLPISSPSGMSLIELHKVAGMPLLKRGLTLLSGMKTNQDPTDILMFESLAYLRKYIEGHKDGHHLSEVLSSFKASFDPTVKMYMSRMKQKVKKEWQSAQRVILAAMIHHSGLVCDVYASAKPEIRTEYQTYPFLEHTVLTSRLHDILRSAVATSRTMIRHIQTLREWDFMAIAEKRDFPDRKKFLEMYAANSSILEIFSIYKLSKDAKIKGARGINGSPTSISNANNLCSDLYDSLVIENKMRCGSMIQTDNAINIVCKRVVSLCKTLRMFQPFCSFSPHTRNVSLLREKDRIIDDDEDEGTDELEDLNLIRNSSVPIRKKSTRRRRIRTARPGVTSTKKDLDDDAEIEGDISLGRVLSERFSSSTKTVKPTPRSVRGRLGQLRSWIDSYRQWKAWSTQGSIDSKAQSDLQSYITPYMAVHNILVGATIDSSEILALAHLHNEKAVLRKQAIEWLTQTIRHSSSHLVKSSFVEIPMKALCAASQENIQTTSYRHRSSHIVLNGLSLAREDLKRNILQSTRKFAIEVSHIVQPQKSATIGFQSLLPVQDAALQQILSIPHVSLDRKLLFVDIQRSLFDHAVASIHYWLVQSTRSSREKKKDGIAETSKASQITKPAPHPLSALRIIKARLECVVEFVRRIISTDLKRSQDQDAMHEIRQLRAHLFKSLVEVTIDIVKTMNANDLSSYNGRELICMLLPFFVASAKKTQASPSSTISYISASCRLDVSVLALALILHNIDGPRPVPRILGQACTLARAFWIYQKPKDLMSKLHVRFASSANFSHDVLEHIMKRLGEFETLDLQQVSDESKDKTNRNTDVKVNESDRYSVVVHNLSARDSSLDEEQWCTIFSKLRKNPCGCTWVVGGKADSKRTSKSDDIHRQKAYQRRMKWRTTSSISTSIRVFNSSTCSANRLEVTSKSSSVLNNVASFRVDTRVTGGKWYFEVEIMNNACSMLRVGWCTQRFNPRPTQSSGSDHNTWVFDVKERVRLHDGVREPYGMNNGKDLKMRKGTVIGCRLDMTKGRMSFYLNSKPLGIAFDHIRAVGGLYPCISMSPGSRVRIHLHVKKFKSRPECWGSYHYPLAGDSSRLSLGSSTGATYMARKLIESLKEKAFVVLAYGGKQSCTRMGQDILALAANVETGVDPVLVTVSSASVVKNLKGGVKYDTKSNTVSKSPQFHIIYPSLQRAMTSELVSLCRYFLIHAKEADITVGLSRLLEAVITTVPYKISRCTSSEYATLVGALTITGGFFESVRVGGYVRLNGSAMQKDMTGVVTDIHPSKSNDIADVLISGIIQSIPVSSLEPISEFSLSLAEFPLSAPIFAALHSLIRRKVGDPSNNKNKIVEAIKPLMLTELQWRAIALLNLAVSSMHSDPSAHAKVESAVYNSLAATLLDLVRNSVPGERLERHVERYFSSREQMWWAKHDHHFREIAPMPVKADSQKRVAGMKEQDEKKIFKLPSRSHSKQLLKVSTPEKKKKSPYSWRYGSNSLIKYLQKDASRTMTDKERANNRLLAHWERYIIPVVRKIMGTNFREYQILDFLEQIRIPLRQGRPFQAISTVLAVTGNECPDGVVFPSPNRNWLLLSEDDVRVGDTVLISKELTSSLSTSNWSPRFSACIGRKARIMCVMDLKKVQAVHRRAEAALALLQVYNQTKSTAENIWVPIHCLEKLADDSDIPRPLLMDSVAFAEQSQYLFRTSQNLARLMARQALFNIASSALSFDRVKLQDIVVDGQNLNDAKQKMQMVEYAVGEALGFQSLEDLGNALPEHKSKLEIAESNFYRLLNASSATKTVSIGHNTSSSEGVAWKWLLDRFKSNLETAMSLKTEVINLSTSKHGGGGAHRRIHVPGAAFLIIMFAENSTIPPKSSIHVYRDAACFKLVRAIKGERKEALNNQLGPLIIPSSRCYLKISETRHGSLDCAIRVVPVRSSLGIALWLVRSVLGRQRHTPTHSHQSMESSSKHKEAVCYEMIEAILNVCSLDTMEPSPFKELLVGLISSLLSSVRGPEPSVPQTSSSMQQPRFIRATSDISDTKTIKSIREAKFSECKSKSNVLQRLKALQSEMLRVYTREIAANGKWISSYAQTLIDTMTTSDALRQPKDQLLPNVRINAIASSVASRSALFSSNDGGVKTTWQCAHCTFENEEGAATCGVCLQPKSVLVVKTSAYSVDTKESPSLSAKEMFHNMRVLIDVMLALASPSEALESFRDHLPDSNLFKVVQACWEESQGSSIVNRLILLRNIPYVHCSNEEQNDEQAWIQKTVQSADSDVVVHPFIATGTCQKWPSVDLYENKHVKRRWRSSETENDMGILYRIGTQDGKIPFRNPALGSNSDVDVKLSTVAEDSNPPSQLLSRTLVPVKTKNIIHSWILIYLRNRYAIPTGYSMIVEARSRPRSWRLEGSNDGSHWVLLMDHKDGSGLVAFDGDGYSTEEKLENSKLLRGSWSLKEDRKWIGFNRFRIMATGTDMTGRWGLVGIRSVEIFGVLGGGELRDYPKAQPTDRFAVVQVMNGKKEKIQKVMKSLKHLRMDLLKLDSTSGKTYIPRIIEVRARLVNDLNLGLKNDTILSQYYQSLLFQGEETPTSRFSTVLATILDRKLEAKTSQTHVLAEKASRVLKEFDIKCEESASKISIAKLKKKILSQPTDKLMSWIQAHGFDLNLCHSHFPNIHTAFAELQSLTESHRKILIRFYIAFAREVGHASVFNLDASQLVDTGVRACEKLKLLGHEYPFLHTGTIRLYFLLLKRFNSWLMDLYPILRQGGSTVELIKKIRTFIFPSVKFDLLAKMLEFTAESNSPTLTVTVNRMTSSFAKSIKKTKQSNNEETEGATSDTTLTSETLGETKVFSFTSSIFYNAFRQLRHTPRSKFRIGKPSGAEPHLAFRIVTENEQVVGEAGPYRQFFTDISRELQGPLSPLLIPTPNHRENTGEHRDKYVLHPASSLDSEGSSMLFFLGQLFGVCIRTGVKMMLSIPPLAWRLLAGEPVGRRDLRDIDHGTSEVLSLFEDLDEKTFSQTFSNEAQNFTIRLSDGSVKELKPNGGSISVRWHTRKEYVDLAVKARMIEQRRGWLIVREGLASIIPSEALNLLTWIDLESSICGRPEIDVAMLRRHTQYSGVSEQAVHIRMFWRLLGKLDQEALRGLIRFCWGQERLPASDKDFEITHTRFLIKSSNYKYPDQTLPRADTCFFNLELPAYSSEAIMKEKLLYAITTAMTMNADQNQAE